MASNKEKKPFLSISFEFRTEQTACADLNCYFSMQQDVFIQQERLNNLVIIIHPMDINDAISTFYALFYFLLSTFLHF